MSVFYITKGEMWSLIFVRLNVSNMCELTSLLETHTHFDSDLASESRSGSKGLELRPVRHRRREATRRSLETCSQPPVSTRASPLLGVGAGTSVSARKRLLPRRRSFARSRGRAPRRSFSAGFRARRTRSPPRGRSKAFVLASAPRQRLRGSSVFVEVALLHADRDGFCPTFSVRARASRSACWLGPWSTSSPS